jgi:hypothetical protein
MPMESEVTRGGWFPQEHFLGDISYLDEFIRGQCQAFVSQGGVTAYDCLRLTYKIRMLVQG